MGRGLLLLIGLLAAAPAPAAVYLIDPAHSFVVFGVSHFNFGVIRGRFNQVEGWFRYDPGNPAASRITVLIETASVDTNFPQRDRYLRSDKFLDVAEYPEAKFSSTRVRPTENGLTIEGHLTLHGRTEMVTIDAEAVGAGADPWGGYRRGFEGTTGFRLRQFGLRLPLVPSTKRVDMELYIEGIRQQ
ncbi:MAG TPA: YceI family protein [Gammaproteobacteria bacterium]|nr:YceI family protein [Gammaproteobacteria bacterium]